VPAISRLWRYLPAYREVAGMWMRTCITYRFSWSLDMLGLLLQIYTLKMIWTAVYAGRDQVDGVPLDGLIAQLTFANLLLWVMYPMLAGYLEERVREGTLALELARPAPFLGQMVAAQIGDTAAGLPLVVVALPLAYLLGGLLPPASPAAGLLFAVSLGLAYAIVVMTGLVIGLVSFWTTEVGGVMTIHAFVSRFFAGALVPLSFFPPWLGTIAGLLPFQAQASIPLALYLGRADGLESVRLLATQLFWVVALLGLARVLWRLALRRVVVYGG
jgi:ABC-2 type transport system permease protein